MVISLPSCSRYDTIAPKTVGVVAERPYEFFNREAGGTIWTKPLEPGQRNLKRGPVIRFDIPVTVQQYEYALDVNMGDRINQDIKVIVNFELLGAGRAPILLVLNALPLDSLRIDDLDGRVFNPKRDLNGENSLTVLTFHPDAVFKKLIHPYMEMIIRDKADEFTSLQMDQEQLQNLIFEDANKLLSQVKFPVVTIDSIGNPFFCDTCLISPLDLIKINGVLVKGYQMPGELAAEIQRSKDLQAQIETVLNEEEGLRVEREMLNNSAKTASKINGYLRTLYNSNPYALPYSKLKQFMEEVKAGTFGDVTVKLLPENSATIVKPE